MPSGYTSKIYEGKPVTKEEFIWDCARAFGALIEMRDEPTEAKVPEEFQPNRFYFNQIGRTERALATLLSLPLEEIEQQIETNHAKEVVRIQKTIKEKHEVKQRYDAMLQEVSNWEPPTEEHVHLKEFCLKQLEESIAHDCGGVQQFEEMHVIKPTAEKWLSEQKAYLLKDIDFHRKRWEEEQRQVEEKNKWVHALRNSLNAKQ